MIFCLFIIYILKVEAREQSIDNQLVALSEVHGFLGSIQNDVQRSQQLLRGIGDVLNYIAGHPIKPVPLKSREGSYGMLPSTLKDTKQLVTYYLPPERALLNMTNIKRIEYLVIFVVNFLETMITKVRPHSMAVIKHFNPLYERNRGRLSFLDGYIHKGFKNIFPSDIDSTTVHTVLFWLKNRQFTLTREQNDVIDKASELIEPKDGQHLMDLIGEFHKFPNINKSGETLCQDIFEAFLRPYEKLKGTPKLTKLMEEIHRSFNESKYKYYGRSGQYPNMNYNNKMFNNNTIYNKYIQAYNKSKHYKPAATINKLYTTKQATYKNKPNYKYINYNKNKPLPTSNKKYLYSTTKAYYKNTLNYVSKIHNTINYKTTKYKYIPTINKKKLYTTPVNFKNKPLYKPTPINNKYKPNYPTKAHYPNKFNNKPTPSNLRFKPLYDFNTLHEPLQENMNVHSDKPNYDLNQYYKEMEDYFLSQYFYKFGSGKTNDRLYNKLERKEKDPVIFHPKRHNKTKEFYEGIKAMDDIDLFMENLQEKLKESKRELTNINLNDVESLITSSNRLIDPIDEYFNTRGYLPPGIPTIDTIEEYMKTIGNIPPGHPTIDTIEEYMKTRGNIPPGHPTIDRIDEYMKTRDTMDEYMKTRGNIPPGHPTTDPMDENRNNRDTLPHRNDRIEEYMNNIGSMQLGHPTRDPIEEYLSNKANMPYGLPTIDPMDEYRTTRVTLPPRINTNDLMAENRPTRATVPLKIPTIDPMDEYTNTRDLLLHRMGTNEPFTPILGIRVKNRITDPQTPDPPTPGLPEYVAEDAESYPDLSPSTHRKEVTVAGAGTTATNNLTSDSDNETSIETGRKAKPRGEYFTTGYELLLKHISLKRPQHVTEVLKHTERIVAERIASKRLNWLGKSLTKIVMTTARVFSRRDIGSLQDATSTLHGYIRERRDVYAKKVNDILDYADHLIIQEDGEKLLATMEEFRRFPRRGKARKTGEQLCEQMVTAFEWPYARLKGTEELAYLIHAATLVANSEYPELADLRRLDSSNTNYSETRFKKTKKNMKKTA